LQLLLDAGINSLDGTAGRIDSVIIHPLTNQLTHIGIAEAASPYLKRLVPLELVRTDNHGNNWLNCTTNQLHRLRPLLEFRDFHGNGLHLQYTTKMYNLWPQNIEHPLPVPVQMEKLAPEAVKIHSRNKVKMVHGVLGTASQFLVNPLTKKVTSLVVKRREWWNILRMVLPVSRVDHFAEDLVLLNLRKADLQEVPVIDLKRKLSQET
jgi:hypothetical protein